MYEDDVTKERRSVSSEDLVNEIFEEGQVFYLDSELSANGDVLFKANTPYKMLMYSQFMGSDAKPRGKSIVLESEQGPWMLYNDEEDPNNPGGLEHAYYIDDANLDDFEENPELALSAVYDQGITDGVLTAFQQDRSLWTLGIEGRHLMNFILNELPFIPNSEMKGKKSEIEEVINYLTKVLNWLWYDPSGNKFKLTELGQQQLEHRFGKTGSNRTPQNFSELATRVK